MKEYKPIIVDHLDLIGDKTYLDDETLSSYHVMAYRLKKLAKKNMRKVKRREKIKRICLKDQNYV